MKILTGKQPRPRRVLRYGQHGVGKSTWASRSPRPLFLNIEDGLADIDCDKTEHLTNLSAVTTSIGWLLNNEHRYGSVVLDTADWLEKRIFAAVAEEAGKPNISEIGFGKGYVAAEAKLDYILAGLDKLRMRRGMFIIFLAHAKVIRFENPETPAYDKYDLDLHRSLSGKLQEWSDEVLFASFRVFTRTEDKGFGRERVTAIGGSERYIRTAEAAVASAKNRLGLPAELPMDFGAYLKFVPALQAAESGNIAGQVEPENPAKQTTAATEEMGEFFEASLNTDISGVVVNGSSKVGAQA